jgi:hypothetical protein
VPLLTYLRGRAGWRDGHRPRRRGACCPVEGGSERRARGEGILAVRGGGRGLVARGGGPAAVGEGVALLGDGEGTEPACGGSGLRLALKLDPEVGARPDRRRRRPRPRWSRTAACGATRAGQRRRKPTSEYLSSESGTPTRYSAPPPPSQTTVFMKRLVALGL